MALFLPGGPAGGSPSGSLGSIVFSHNKGGSYMRTRKVPTNPASAAQVLARNRLSTLTNNWHNGLTEAQRASWDTYAANVPVTNRIGQQIYLSGLNWYVACNSLRSQAGGTISWVDDAPVIFNLATFHIISCVVSEAAQQLSIFFDTGDDWLDDDGALLAYATRPQNPTVNYNNLPFRFAGAVPGVTATPPTSPQTIAVPFAVVEDQRVFVRFNCINADGRIGAQHRLTVDVVA